VHRAVRPAVEGSSRKLDSSYRKAISTGLLCSARSFSSALAFNQSHLESVVFCAVCSRSDVDEQSDELPVHETVAATGLIRILLILINLMIILHASNKNCLPSVTDESLKNAQSLYTGSYRRVWPLQVKEIAHNSAIFDQCFVSRPSHRLGYA